MLNKVMLIGRLTADPELKEVGGGSQKTDFRLALNRKYKDSSGTMQEEATFVPVSCWNKTAENVAKYLGKGSLVYVEGRISIRNYEVDGVNKVYTEVVAQNVTFLESKGASSHTSDSTIPFTGNEEVPF